MRTFDFASESVDCNQNPSYSTRLFVHRAVHYVAAASLTLSTQSERVVGIGEIFTQVGKKLLHQLPLGIVFKAPVE